MGRDLKNRNGGYDVNLLKFNLYLCNYMTCWQKNKQKQNTSRRSKDLVKQRNCQQSAGWWSGSVLLVPTFHYVSIFLFLFPTHHTRCPLSTLASLVWSRWMFTPQWDAVQIQMAVQMGQSKCTGMSFIGCSPLMH